MNICTGGYKNSRRDDTLKNFTLPRFVESSFASGSPGIRVLSFSYLSFSLSPLLYFLVPPFVLTLTLRSGKHFVNAQGVNGGGG